MKNRVVITGLGVVAPNGVGLEDFKKAIKNGVSGIRYIQELADLNFESHIGGVPQLPEGIANKYFTPLELMKFNANGILYGVIAGMDAWKDAGLKFAEDDKEPDWDSGMIYGIGSLAADKLKQGINQTENLQVKRLGSNYVIQTMPSGISVYLTGKLGIGNQATINSSACETGTESILMAYGRIKNGKAKPDACSRNQ